MKKAESIWREGGGAVAKLRRRAAERARVEEIARAHLARAALPPTLCGAVTVDDERGLLVVAADDGAQAAKLRWILRPLAAEINRERARRGAPPLTETQLKIENPIGNPS